MLGGWGWGWGGKLFLLGLESEHMGLGEFRLSLDPPSLFDGNHIHLILDCLRISLSFKLIFEILML